MNITLWIIAGLLGAVFLASGATKLAQPKEKLAASSKDFGPGTLRLIGALEVLGAIGLILPAALGIAEVLVPLAAIGVALLMAGACFTHLRRRETQGIVVTLVLLALGAVVAWGRFGPYSM
ncbi:DoxX family protein [Amycolatopsis sp.]|uniref:DoxX family protein n=1 Tax=Amycolatopsis sp. TaxID=37632 RepID=UPI002C7EEFCC|nr:DoxX family protein [Amycolatopsis sp.]HVV09845.1 DoxX family protein [Amycolatopsis sp.]